MLITFVLLQINKKCYTVGKIEGIDMKESNNAQELLDIIQKSKHVAVLTGAGISTLSGIPDFRGVGGLYSRKDIDANKLFDIHYFRRDPSYYYINTRNFLYEVAAKPNIVHETLAKMEQKGLIKAVITQNIDLLHQKAGSKTVFELHGSPMKHYCLSCGKEFDFDTVLSMIQEKEVPYCPHCGGIIKPKIVFFGESLPEYDLDNAEYHAQHADFLLVLGTSLTVYPAAAIPEITYRAGGKLGIVNASPTYIDKEVIYKANDLGEIFEKLNAFL